MGSLYQTESFLTACIHSLLLRCMSQASRDRVNSRRVRTHQKKLGDAVRRLGTIIQSIFCAQSGVSIRLTVWKWSGESRIVYHLPQIPGNSCWDVNGKCFYFLGRPTWKLPGQTEILKSYSRFPSWDVPNGSSFTIHNFLEFRTSFRPLGIWPSAITSTLTTTNMMGSQQMGDCASVHAAVIPLQFWKYT